MPTISVKFQKATPTRLRVEIEKDGQPFIAYSFLASSLTQQKTLAKHVGVTVDKLTPLMKTAELLGESEATFGDDSEAFTLYIRGMNQPAEQAKVIEEENALTALSVAMGYKNLCVADPVIVWDDITRLAVVDIDYHSIPLHQRPSYTVLDNIAANIRPMPVLFHPSHGRGCKLYYVATEGFTAEEIAAAGAMSWLSADGRATAEIKRETRHPFYSRMKDGVMQTIPSDPHCPGKQPLNLEEIAKWYARQASEEAINAYLEEKGLTQGKRYSHSHCPIDPDTPSHGEPVYVGENGIFCHRCSGVGNVYGTRRTPGFIAYSSLIGGLDSEVYDMAFHKVHWEHAKYVLNYAYRLPEKILRLAYSCALKLLHKPDNPAVSGAFNTEAIARVGGKWMFTSDQHNTTVDKNAKNIIAKLPATWNVWRSELGMYSVKTDLAKVESIAHTKRDLTEYGYADLQPIHGMPIYGRKLPYAAGVTPYPDKFLHLPSDRRPKYIPKRTPEQVKAAWDLLELSFPDIDRKFVRLLFAAKGIAESGKQNVFISVDGVAGSGKSTTTAVVAGLLGDKHNEGQFTKDTTRLRQIVIDAMSGGSFLIIDEIFKTATKERLSFRQALDPILTLTKKSKSHEMYVGPVSMPCNGVFVFTDIEVPQEVKDDIQLSRRLFYIKLLGRVDWVSSMLATGLDKPENFRMLSPEHAFAADLICSELSDEFFSDIRSMSELASMCGVTHLEHSKDFSDSTDMLYDLFQLVCDAPPLSEVDRKKVSGEGFKRISNADSSDLRDTWDQLADGQSGQAWKYSRRIKEIDWALLLTRRNPSSRIPRGVNVDIRHFKDSTIFIRFRLGSYEQPDALNEGIITWKPPTL